MCAVLSIVWPVAGKAQQPMRRIGVLAGFTSAEEARPYTSALEKGLEALGWTLGRGLQIDYRFADNDSARTQMLARELVASAPDVLLGVGTSNLVALSQQTRALPIVFIQVTNPERDGFVASLERPGGNITGVSNPDVGLVGERIKVLKQIVPRMTRVLVLFEPDYPTAPSSLRMAGTTAAGLGMRVVQAGARSMSDVERAVADFAREPNGGMIVIQSSLFGINRQRVAALSVQHAVPGMFHLRAFIANGGLASFGIDQVGMWAQAPRYVDRILKGEKPGDIAVQEPEKSEFIINMKAARQLGLDIPRAVLSRATEVVE
jgi:putative ABC transport system substrate-binding protein